MDKINFKIKSVDQYDLDSLAEFLSINHGGLTKKQWFEKFELIWNLNPYFDEKKVERGWIIIDNKKDIYGFLGNIPFVYLIDGSPEQIYCGTTWIVSKEARGESLKLYEQLNNQNGWLINTTGTADVNKILSEIFHYTKIDLSSFETNYILPVNLLFSFKFIFGYYKNNFLKKIFSILGAVIIKVITLINYFIFKKKIGKISINHCSKPPNDIDEFNNKLISKYNFVFPRNKKNIEWLYFSSNKSPILFEVRENKSLIGLISFLHGTQYGSTRFDLLDFSILDTSPAVLNKIIIEIQKLLKQMKKDISFITFKSYDNNMKNELMKFGFYKFKSKNYSNFYIRNFNSDKKISNVHLTSMDGDRSFFNIN